MNDQIVYCSGHSILTPNLLLNLKSMNTRRKKSDLNISNNTRQINKYKCVVCSVRRCTLFSKRF